MSSDEIYRRRCGVCGDHFEGFFWEPARCRRCTRASRRRQPPGYFNASMGLEPRSVFNHDLAVRNAQGHVLAHTYEPFSEMEYVPTRGAAQHE